MKRLRNPKFRLRIPTFRRRQSERLNSFGKPAYSRISRSFKGRGVADVVKSLLDILEKCGNCPSVSMKSSDTESADLFSVRDNLVKVPLKDHSYAVAYNLIEGVKKAYVDYENHVPKVTPIGRV